MRMILLVKLSHPVQRPATDQVDQERRLGRMITAQCSTCQATYRVPEEKAGRMLKCKKCGSAIKVSASEADEFGELLDADLVSRPASRAPLPAPARRRPAGSKPRAAKSHERDGLNPLWLILGGVATLIVFGVGAFFAVEMLFKSEAAPVANAPPVLEAPAAPGGAAGAVAPAVEGAPAVAGPIPLPIVPAPEEDLAALEALTFEALEAQLAGMESAKTEGIVENVGAGAVFRDAWTYRDAARGVEVVRTVVRQVGQRGTASTETYRVQHSNPRYAGWFQREAFGASDDSAFTHEPRRSGQWILKRDDGTLRARGEYFDGQRHGWFTFYDSDGSIVWQGLYLSDELSRSQAFAPDQESFFGETALFLGDEAWLQAVAFSPDGELVAMGDAWGFVWIRNVETREIVNSFRVDHQVQELEFSPTEPKLAIGHNSFANDAHGAQGYLTIVDYSADAEVAAPREVFRPLRELRFTQDGATVLATLGGFGPVAAFAAGGGNAKIVAPGRMAFYRNGEAIALEFGHEIVVLDGASVSFDSLPELRPNQQTPIDLDDSDEYAEFKQEWTRRASQLRGPGGQPPLFVPLPQVYEIGAGPPVFLAGGEGVATSTPLGVQFASAQPNRLPVGLPLTEVHRSLTAAADGSVLLTWTNSGDRNVDTRVHFRDGQTREVLGVLPEWPQGRAKQWYVASDGSTIAVTIDVSDRADTQLVVYDVKRGRLKALDTHVWDLEAVAYSLDGRLLATVGKDSECFVWDIEEQLSSGAGAAPAGPPLVKVEMLSSAELLEGDPLIATVQTSPAAPDALARQYRVRESDPWRPFWGETLKAGPMPAGKLELQVRVTDSTGAEAVAAEPVNVAPNPYSGWTLLHRGDPGAGRMLVTAKGRILRYGTDGDDPILEAWKLPGFESVALPKVAPPSLNRRFVGLLAVNPDETVLAVNNYTDSRSLTDVVSLLSLDDGRHLRDLPGDPELDPNQDLQGLTFLPTGELVSIHAARNSSAPKRVSVWDINSGERLNHFAVAGEIQSDVMPLPWAPQLIAAIIEGQVTTLSLTDGSADKGPFAQTFAIVPAGGQLLCGSGYKPVRVYEFPPFSTKPVKELKDVEAAQHLLISPDGETLVIDDSSSQTLLFHRVNDGRELRQLRICAGPEKVWQAQFTSDGGYLVTLDSEGRISVWGEPE